MGKYLMQFICPKCGRHVAWALPRAKVSCGFCGAKIEQKNIKTPNPARLPLDSDQLVMFSDFLNG
ncbi:MAG: hypothetical protein LBO03_00565 [Acidaminococcales bacterium]|nr:hypothetical protein [Acidaminococcales bacterium]MDR3348092.1 hypothetical protein [Acidaminococcales bacterium]